MKIVCTSDWHLDQSTAGVDRFEDTCQAIDVSVDAAIAMKADAYLMCGDLTDPNNVRSHRAVAKAVQVQMKLCGADVFPIWVVGNHDVIEDGSGVTTMSALSHCAPDYADHVIAEPCVVAVRDGKRWRRCDVIGLPFTASSHAYNPDEYIRSLVGKVDAAGPVLIVGHLNHGGITPGSETADMPRGREVFWPMEAIRECFPNSVVIGGHYHTPQEYDGCTIIGSMSRLRFDERDNDLGYLVVDL